MTIRFGKNETIISFSKFFWFGNNFAASSFNFFFPIIYLVFACSGKSEQNHQCRMTLSTLNFYY